MFWGQKGAPFVTGSERAGKFEDGEKGRQVRSKSFVTVAESESGNLILSFVLTGSQCSSGKRRVVRSRLDLLLLIIFLRRVLKRNSGFAQSVRAVQMTGDILIYLGILETPRAILRIWEYSV